VPGRQRRVADETARDHEQCSCFPVRLCFGATADATRTGSSVDFPGCTSLPVFFALSCDAYRALLETMIVAGPGWRGNFGDTGMDGRGVVRVRSFRGIWDIHDLEFGVTSGNVCLGCLNGGAEMRAL
jgi:hypothetical protein